MFDRRQVESSRSFGTGSYGNSVVPYENHDAVPELSAEQVKQAYEQALAENQQHQMTLERAADADAWKSEHPEYVDSNENASLMRHQLLTMFGDTQWSFEQFDAAFEALCASNFLKIDQKELVKKLRAAEAQRAKAARRRIAEQTARNFNENADYSDLSLEEIKRRANEEMRTRNQRIAEDGGYY